MTTDRDEFEAWALKWNYDTANAHSDGVTRWLSPMTRDLYLAWIESRAALRQALAQPVPDVAAVMQERDDLRFQRDLSRELMREQAARIAELEQGQDALDAKRYRWLREINCRAEGLDSDIDAAISTQPAPAPAAVGKSEGARWLEGFAAGRATQAPAVVEPGCAAAIRSGK